MVKNKKTIIVVHINNIMSTFIILDGVTYIPD